MRVYLLNLWDAVRTSFWFLPSLFAGGAVLLYAFMGWLDAWIGPDWIEPGDWLYIGEIAGVRALLTAVVGSIITVISVVFSVVVVALTMAASQMGPRLLQNFMRDRVTGSTLGVFMGTFLYTILVLRQANGLETEALPQLTVNVGLLLLLVSMAMLVYFIHHIAQRLQAPHVVAEVATELNRTLDQFLLDKPADDRWTAFEEVRLPDAFKEASATVVSRRGGYIQTLDLDRLLDIASEHDVLLRMPRRARDFVVPGEVLVEIFPGDRCTKQLDQAVRRSFYIQRQRTTSQDVEYALQEIVEVALRALSPAINDPFTAINCADHISEAMCQVAQRQLPEPERRDGDGQLRLVCITPSFDEVLSASFEQLRMAAAGHPIVACRLLDGLERIARFTNVPHRIESIRNQATAVRDAALPKAELPKDRQNIHQHFARVVESIENHTLLHMPGRAHT